MEEFVAKENIRRFEAQLAQCDDVDKRHVLLRLLEQERKRLNDIQGGAAPSGPSESPAGGAETA